MQPTFENTWPKAPFAELICLALSLAETLVKLRARLTQTARVQHA